MTNARKSSFRRNRFLPVTALLAGAAAFPALAAPLDESTLPAPATRRVDFARDIKPIIDASCIRCHGPQKPKSGFRLDTRASAMKVGQNGVDILPGDSGKSPLIHYVARAVADMEMPPEGKGAPLTSQQVGLLRAWIDQGAAWDNQSSTNLLDATVAVTAGGTFVTGDKQKFREQYWRRDGFYGGLERFDIFDQPNADTTMSLNGHVLPDDYKLTLNLDRNDVGFVHAGWEEYRQYYDGFGTAYVSPTVTLFPRNIDTDLHLDVGNAWIDLGLTPPNWPRMVLGYEYDYKDGQEAITSWQSAGTAGKTRNIAPASNHLNEGTHVLKFDISGEVAETTIEDNFRAEFYKLNTHYTNVAARSATTQNVHEGDESFQGANSLRFERRFKDTLFASGGYFYSKLNADDSFSDDTVLGKTLYAASVPSVLLKRESHVFNLNGVLGPYDGLTIVGGAQADLSRQQSLGSGGLNSIAYVSPPNANLAIHPATLASDYEQTTLSETLGLRYARIPFTSVFADARLQQETISQSDTDVQPGASFSENPSFNSRLSDLTTGFNTSPWRGVFFSAHYRFTDDVSRYETNSLIEPVGGYPGLISSRDLVTDEAEAKLAFRPCNWLRMTLSYQNIATDFHETTRPTFTTKPAALDSPGGPILGGRYYSQVYSLGATFTPLRRLSVTSAFSYQDTAVITELTKTVPPYKGGVYSALSSATYIVNASTDLTFSYTFSLADYSLDNVPYNANNPPPLGINYEQHALQVALSRRINTNLTARLQYNLYHYDQANLLGAGDFNASAIFATLTYRFR